MTPSELKAKYLANNPEGFFFTRKTMAFFGDTMRNYGVRDAGENWELYRKRAVKHGLKTSHYFSKSDFSNSTSN